PGSEPVLCKRSVAIEAYDVPSQAGLELFGEMVEESRDVLKRGTWHPIKNVARERTPAAYRIALKLRAQTARALRSLHGLPQLTWRTNGSLPYLSEARQLQALIRPQRRRSTLVIRITA